MKDLLPELSANDLNQLRESIRKNGVLVPVILTEDGEVIDGKARVSICLEFKIRNYPRRIIGNLSQSERTEYRIRINAERRHLTRDQRTELLKRYILASPRKSTREVADTLKTSKDIVSRVKRGLGVVSDTVGKDGRVYKHKPAVSVETQSGAKIAGKLLTGLEPGSVSGGISTRRLRREVFEQETERYSKGRASKLPDSAKLLNTDFRHSGIAKNSVHLGLVDPPWGEEHWHQLPDLGREYHRILRPGAYLASYCGAGQIAAMIDAFRNSGLEYLWHIAALNPVDAAGIGGVHHIRRMHRSILLFKKAGPERLGSRWLIDVIQGQPQDIRYHPWQQPLHESQSLVLGLSRLGDTVVDLCAGSGTSGVAAIGLGRKWIGCELVRKTFLIAQRRLGETAPNAVRMAQV